MSSFISRDIALLFLSTAAIISPINAQVADPKKHPYADPTKNREGYEHSTKKVNEFRLYDFYQRQADYYMAKPAAELPALLPSYPGLDAGWSME